MQAPEIIDLKISLSEIDNLNTYARFQTRHEQGTITQYLPAHWDEVLIQNPDTPEDILIEALIDIMLITYLCERICIERAVQGIRTKGGRCNPCCIEPIACKMFDHCIPA